MGAARVKCLSHGQWRSSLGLAPSEPEVVIEVCHHHPLDHAGSGRGGVWGSKDGATTKSRGPVVQPSA